MSATNSVQSNGSGAHEERPLIPQPHGGALRMIPKGVSGNPGGRPKWKPMLDAYHRICKLSPAALAKFKPQTAAEHTAWNLIRRSWSTKDRLAVAAAREITDRLEGPVVQTQRHTGADGESDPTLHITVSFSPQGTQVAKESREILIEGDESE